MSTSSKPCVQPVCAACVQRVYCALHCNSKSCEIVRILGSVLDLQFSPRFWLIDPLSSESLSSVWELSHETSASAPGLMLVPASPSTLHASEAPAAPKASRIRLLGWGLNRPYPVSVPLRPWSPWSLKARPAPERLMQPAPGTQCPCGASLHAAPNENADSWNHPVSDCKSTTLLPSCNRWPYRK